MTKKSAHLATKAQATAVRDYLKSLGFELSHVQALEVLARGQGMRSRHVLAKASAGSTSNTQTAAQWVDANVQGNPVLMQAMRNHAQAAEGGDTSSTVAPATPRGHWTRVSYGYIDGSNCKRFSSTVFSGRLTPDQLRFIVSRLDEGMYFVPAQVGFECLTLAFNDQGDDHYWHKMEIADEEEWELDADGYVLRAGDIEQVFSAEARDFATDANTDNLFWCFARLTTWDYGLQEQAVNQHVWRAHEPFPQGYEEQDVQHVIAGWKQHPWLAKLPAEMLERLANWLLGEDMLPFPTTTQELRRPVGPNAYQFCILQQPEEGGAGDLVLNIDVSTQAGDYLTHSSVVRLTAEAYSEELVDAMRLLSDQRRAARFIPATYDPAFA